MLELMSAGEADLPAICALGGEVNALHVDAWPQIFRRAGEPLQDEAFWREWLGKPDAVIVLAKRDDAVLGMATAQIIVESASLLVPMTFCRIGTVAVTATERGRGVGRALMRHVEEWAAGHGARDLRLNVWKFNERASAFYRELGFDVRSLFMGKFL
jgi:ribosomal protein S18 acetylase RimI-like enzyme